MHSSGQSNNNLVEFIKEEKGHQQLVRMVVADLGQNLGLEEAIKSIGWHGLRNRLAWAFLERQRNGHFPHQYTGDLIPELLKFEALVTPFTVEGHSRAFQLAFYLKMSLIHLTQNDSEKKFDNLLIGEDIFNLLKLAKTKIVKIDWILLFLKHLESYLGQKELKEKLVELVPFDKIISDLKEPDRNEMMANMLSYGGSVNDSDFLASRRV
mgnify:CR=1 FL=1|jgi:hypothetical protein